MINQSNIIELATREQTTELNIVREYLQHLFLRSLYKKEGSDRFLFKGGTAIRIIFRGSRYSEDLDFSIPRLSQIQIEDILTPTFLDLSKEGVTSNMQIHDATPTGGGYLADIELDILGYTVRITFNLQIKEDPKWLEPQAHVITTPLFLPSYSLMALKDELIVHEKIQALIERHKARDVFDAYFFARDQHLRQFLPHDPETLQRIDKALNEVTEHDLESDLKPFLPRNYQSVIKQLKDSVRTELGIK